MRHIIIVLVVIIVIFVIEYFVYKNKWSHYVNYLKYTKVDDDISLEDSNIYIGKNPTDECISQDNCLKVPRINYDSSLDVDFEKLLCSDTNNAADCLHNNKCKTVVLPDVNPSSTTSSTTGTNQQDKVYCRSDNDINVENDLIVDDYLLLGDTQDHQIKIDINLIRKIKNLPYHFDKTAAINNEDETICLVNGPVDLPRCVEDDEGKYYIKTKGGDETIDSGYDETKDCKYTIPDELDSFKPGNPTPPNPAGYYIENSKFRTLKHCKKYLEDNYQTIKNKTDTQAKIDAMCYNLESQYEKKTDERVSCIQKHHLEMLNGDRPIALRTFGNVYPFTFFQRKYNALPRFKYGMENNENMNLPAGSGQGPKSVNVKRNYELKVYSGPNYTGSSKTIKFPGSRNVGFSNGIRSYKTKVIKEGATEKLEYGKAKNVCLSKNKLKLPPNYNANASETEIFTVKPCSYDDADQLFYINFEKGSFTTDGHEHPHIHGNDDTHS